MKNAQTLIALVIAMLLAVAFAEEAEKKEGPAIKMLIFNNKGEKDLEIVLLGSQTTS